MLFCSFRPHPRTLQDPHPVILPASPTRTQQPERRYSVERRPSTGEPRGPEVSDNVFRSRSPTSSLLLNGRSKNETDEHKVCVDS